MAMMAIHQRRRRDDDEEREVEGEEQGTKEVLQTALPLLS